jgi:hypothetical protein
MRLTYQAPATPEAFIREQRRLRMVGWARWAATILLCAALLSALQGCANKLERCEEDLRRAEWTTKLCRQDLDECLDLRPMEPEAVTPGKGE